MFWAFVAEQGSHWSQSHLPETGMWLLLVGVRVRGAHKQDPRCLHETLWGESNSGAAQTVCLPPGRRGGPGTPDTSLCLQASLGVP